MNPSGAESDSVFRDDRYPITRSIVTHLARHPAAAVVLVAVVASLSYSNTFLASFHFDDLPNIVNNNQIRHLETFWNSAGRSFSGSRDIGFLTFALNYSFGRENVVGYHVVNLVIHIVNGLLVYALIALLAKTPGIWDEPVTGSTQRINGIALTAALLFVAHPIQTQGVTYIVQRFTSLATLFYLAGVVCYLQWRSAKPASRIRNGWYAGALVSTILAMKSKEISFTLPLMLLLLEGVCFRATSWRRWLPLVPFLLTLSIIPLAFAGATGEAQLGVARETTEISRSSYLFTQFRVVVTYLRLLLVPIHQNVDYDYPHFESFLALPVSLSFLVLFGLFGVAAYWLSKQFPWRLAALGLLWFFLTLSVESSIIPIRDVIFEHRLYLPSIGIFLSASAITVGRLARPRLETVVAVGVVVVLLGVITYQRNRVWHDELTLWSDAVAKSPMKARVHSSLGLAYAERGRLAEAIGEFLTAQRLQPSYPEAHNHLGLAYTKQGRFTEAIAELETAIRLRPNYVEAHNNLGAAYTKMGRFTEAMMALETAIRLRADYPEVHNNLANAYAAQGRLKDAIEQYQVALELKPEYVEARNNLGNTYAREGRFDGAIQEYQRALEIDPEHVEAQNNLGNVYALQGKLGEAARRYQTALQLEPDYAEAHNNLGSIYMQQGRLEEAGAEFVTAVQLRPNFPEAHNNLGTILIRQGRLDSAIVELGAALQLKAAYPEAHLNLGIAYARKGRMDEAISHYVTALKIDPSLFKAHYYLGKAYQQRGSVNQARQHFELALKLAPNFEPATQALETLPAAGPASR